MGKFVREFIEYEGIDKYNEIFKGDSFKYSSLDIEIILPQKMSKVDEIIKVNVKKEIDKKTLVRTPVGISQEGYELTGNSMLILGDIRIKLQYMSDEYTGGISSFVSKHPFGESLVLPKKFNEFNIFSPQIYIEDIYVQKEEDRLLRCNLTILIVIEI